MKFTFVNKKLAKQCGDATEMKKSFGLRAKQLALRLDEISASPTLATLLKIPGADCHQLTGKRHGQWAVRISGNYRLLFELDEDPLPMKNLLEIDTSAIKNIRLLEILDYH